MSKLNWPADKLYACVLLENFSAQAIGALDLNLRMNPFVVIQQNAMSHKSRVWACSPRAQRLKIKRGSPAMELKVKHRDLLLVKQNPEFEKLIQDDLSEIISRRSPDFEVKGKGVFVVNLSHLLLNPKTGITEILSDLQEEIKYKVNLEQVAIGLSATKMTAWIMARTKRPDGLKFCYPHEEVSALGFLSCSFLPGLTYASRQRLKKYGLNKIGQLQQFEKVELVRRFGAEGEKIYGMIRGVDFKLRSAEKRPVFSETVFEKDVINQREIDEFIRHTADKLCYQLKLKKLLADRITLMIRYTDNKTSQRTANLPFASNDFYLMADLGEKLFVEVYLRRVAIKSLRIIIKKPLSDFGQQKLFETAKEKKKRLLQTGITRIRKKFLFKTVFNASELVYIQKEKGKTEKNKSAEGNLRCPPGFIVNKQVMVGWSDTIQFKQSKSSAKTGKSLLTAWLSYQKRYNFLELCNTYRNESLITDFTLIESLSRGKTAYSILVHQKISQPEIIDVERMVPMILKQLHAAGPLFKSGRIYSFLIRLKAHQVKSQRLLTYLLKISRIFLKANADVHIEFTHISWYTEYIFSLLKDEGIGICNPGLIDSEKLISTRLASTSKAYIRYDRQGAGLKRFILSQSGQFDGSSFSLPGNADKTALVYNKGPVLSFLDSLYNL